MAESENSFKMIDRLSEHLQTRIQVHLGIKAIIYEELKIMGIIASSVVVILLFSARSFSVLQIGLHTLLYAGCFGLGDLLSRIIPLFYAFNKNDKPYQSIGTIWLSSFVGFFTGFFIFSTLRFQAATIAPDLFNPVDQVLYFKKFFLFLPIWFLVTYLMVIKDISKKAAITKNSSAELTPAGNELSQSVNPAEVQTNENEAKSGIPFFLPKGCLIESLPSESISHISVTEHYTDIYYQRNDQTKSIQIRMSLKEALMQLPENAFIQIHRSHVVNLNHICDVDKKNGQLQILICEGEITLPVSRRKTDEVLEILRKRTDII